MYFLDQQVVGLSEDKDPCDIPKLLRKLADTLEQEEITDVNDIVFHTIHVDGEDRPYFSIYYVDDDGKDD